MTVAWRGLDCNARAKSIVLVGIAKLPRGSRTRARLVPEWPIVGLQSGVRSVTQMNLSPK
jgi:hypothetical protein